MIIRPENSNDVPAIQRVTKAAFAQPGEADLIDALRATGNVALSLVAENDGHILGHVMFSKLQTPAKGLAIGPVSVVPEAQSRGIGSKLIRTGLALAKDAGWHAVFLLGEPSYYERFGFRVEAAAKFETPYPKSYFMAQDLAPDALASLSGPVVYAAPFQELD